MQRQNWRALQDGRNILFALCVGLVSSTSALAEEVVFELDPLSFFFYEGTREAGTFPNGSTIPMKLERQSPSEWTVTIAPGDLALPPITFPSGKRAEWKLSRPATGTLSLNDGKASIRIRAPLDVYVDGSRRAIPFPLNFTTENVESRAKGWVAARKGARLDPDSGVVQLVAAGISPPTAASSPGNPFYVVLSGRFPQLPTELVALATP